MLGNNSKASTAVHAPKTHEKRATNSSQPDDDERVPKRRLVGNFEDSTESKSNIYEEDNSTNKGKASISIDIKTKRLPENTQNENNAASTKLADIKMNEDNLKELQEQDEKEKEDTKSPKEKQCWNLYCKMIEKGVNVSFDTILRGMLTPTEYRMSKKNFDKEEAKQDKSGNPL